MNRCFNRNVTSKIWILNVFYSVFFIFSNTILLKCCSMCQAELKKKRSCDGKKEKKKQRNTFNCVGYICMYAFFFSLFDTITLPSILLPNVIPHDLISCRAYLYFHLCRFPDFEKLKQKEDKYIQYKHCSSVCSADRFGEQDQVFKTSMLFNVLKKIEQRPLFFAVNI